MAEYIEREAAIDCLMEILDKPHHAEFLYTDEICDTLNSIPAADVRPVVRGKWTLNKDGSGTCSECGRTQKNCWDLDNWDNFCHFCGADMRGEEN